MLRLGLSVVLVGVVITILGLLEPVGELLLLGGALIAAISMEPLAGLPITGQDVKPGHEPSPVEDIRSAA